MPEIESFGWFEVVIVWKKPKHYAPGPEYTYTKETKTLREDERNRLRSDWEAYQKAVADPAVPRVITRDFYLVVNPGIREPMPIDFKEVESLEFKPEPIKGFKAPTHYDSIFVDMEYAGLR